MANHHQNMSLEAMLDQERRDVLAVLEGTTTRPRGSVSSAGSGGRSPSPRNTSTSRPPIRSMLDVDAAPPLPPRRASDAATNGGITPATRPTAMPIRSMLDVDSPPPSTPPVRSMLDVTTPPPGSPAVVKGSQSAQTPRFVNEMAHATTKGFARSSSDAASRPVEFGPRATRVDPTEGYQFSGYLTSNPGGPIVPKRNTQAGKRGMNSMAEVVRGGVDLSGFVGRDRGRHNSLPNTGLNTAVANAKSKSPHNRLSLRSPSPGIMSPTDPSKFAMLDDGRVIDVNSAYRRLSDANLALSNGGLSSLTKKSRRARSNSGSVTIPEDARLEKDYLPLDGDHELYDSSDDDGSFSDEEGHRGRRKGSRSVDGDESEPESKTLGMGRAKGPRTPLSLMAAAEEERKQIASKEATLNEKYKVRSLLDPEITVTGPSGVNKSSKPVVHPHTSFDQDASSITTPHDSDTEADISDIKRAQKLSITMTPIISTPATGRCVRTIYRGEFKQMQQEAHDNHRRVRKYLVATDLSEEAAHALEWTIGTVLRDGDTLLAIYCVDEELGITPAEDSGDSQILRQAAAVAAQASSSRPSAANTPLLTPSLGPSPLGPNYRSELSSITASATTSPMGRAHGKAEHDRNRAVQDITDRVTKLLRKTKLQVKVVVEVIHCKSPKHLITEVIDFVSPTLVILGSRGRSALKGVILGSFSNYLVTKSSVPVMVARKRLRKHSKYKRPNIRLTNNLANPVKSVNSLANAKID